MKIIYDLGANNGDDIPYYLLKSDLVVAVEANPGLCTEMRQRFSEAIRTGRLVVEECVVTVDAGGEVPFFVHKMHHVLGRLPYPGEPHMVVFDEIRLPSRNVLDIIETHGDPFYIKIDVEEYDQYILRYLFKSGVFPPYISAEVHSAEAFGALVGWGEYSAFKVVDGILVPDEYTDHQIEVADSQLAYSFPMHSAGPFGNDIRGPWLTANSIFDKLAKMNLGWRDVHASRIDAPTA